MIKSIPYNDLIILIDKSPILKKIIRQRVEDIQMQLDDVQHIGKSIGLPSPGFKVVFKKQN